MSGLAMFSLKCPSLLNFEERTRHESRNLKRVFNIEAIPSDTQFRTVMDKVPANSIRHKLIEAAQRFQKARGFKPYRYHRNKMLVSIDGVEHFCSEKIHCKHCLTRKHRNGKTSYHHQMLCAVMVHPDHPTVIPLDAEPVINSDGFKKNDCERTASKRLLRHLAHHYPDQSWILLEDALFATAPNIRQIQDNRWNFILAVKPKSHKTLFKNLERRLASGLAHRHTIQDGDIAYHFSYANKMAFSESDAELKVNMLSVEIEQPGHPTRRFSFISDLPLRKNNLMKILTAARTRWKIENETFNTLKNQGYHFEHNYGHGDDQLATGLAFLMLLAFLIDQIQQATNSIFKKIIAELKTKAKFWESLRAVFKIKPVKSMNKVYLTIAELYQIKIE